MILALIYLFLAMNESHAMFGPEVRPTKGEIWPKPRLEERYSVTFVVDPKKFEFQIVGQYCPILLKALERYSSIMKSTVKYGIVDADVNYETRKTVKNVNNAAILQALRIDLKEPCEEYPSDKMDESYNLVLTQTSPAMMVKNRLSADSIWGMLRGLETFSQILVPDPEGRLFLLDGIFVADWPQFPHRGLLLDTARHFYPVPEIMRILDGMAYSKMNVFHWHIVDDHAFAYQSKVFPHLSAKGAYHPELAVYMPTDVSNVIEYARDRGIRVIPEFDTPGHTQSWGKSVDGLLTECLSPHNVGPIDPTRKENYIFLEKLFSEVATVFKDKYVHLGGDEVDSTCWYENSNIANFMDTNGMSRNFTLLGTFYFNQLFNITERLKLKPMVWEDVLEMGVPVHKGTIIHLWKAAEPSSIYPIVSQGYKAVFSACWYLDRLPRPWKDFYRCSILDFSGSAEQKALVTGGEACMWGEMVDELSGSARIFPRTCAVAERLWTYGDGNPSTWVAARLEEHTCRLKRRGVPTGPANGAGYCPTFSHSKYDTSRSLFSRL